MLKRIKLDASELSYIELQLLAAVSTGASNKHIARQLGKSEFTVRNQLSNLFKKINVDNRTQAAGRYGETVIQAETPDSISTSVPLLSTESLNNIEIRNSV